MEGNGDALRKSELTSLLIEWRDGDAASLDRLMPLVYTELRRLANAYIKRERSDHSLDPTDLVHEAYLRLVDKTHPQWRDRVHFYAVAAQVMRRVLVDHARKVRSAKRGGNAIKVHLEVIGEVAERKATDVLELDDALKALEKIDTRKNKIIELRYFGGLTIEETAGFLGVSTATVIADARLARAWLYDQMKQSRPPE